MKNRKRNCPECGIEIVYKRPSRCRKAEELGCLCKVCANSGERNSFRGKRHSEETKRRLSLAHTGKKATEKQKEVLRKGSNKKPVYQCWLEKYGKEEADLRMENCKQKHSQNNSGEKNAMYGKPAPQGSGNGWSGWYKGWYFRSLKELTYVVGYLEPSNLSWVTGENIKINYVNYAGNERTYRPDFIVDGRVLVEIKPNRLHKSNEVLSKKIAAEKYCSENGLEYILYDPGDLNREKLIELHKCGDVKFLDRYEVKFKERFLSEN